MRMRTQVSLVRTRITLHRARTRATAVASPSKIENWQSMPVSSSLIFMLTSILCDSMAKVYKYRLSILDEQVVNMPKGAKVLSVQSQNGAPCIWAAVNPDETECERRKFRMAGTGHPIDDSLVNDYIGSFMLYDGALVFHLFEIK